MRTLESVGDGPTLIFGGLSIALLGTISGMVEKHGTILYSASTQRRARDRRARAQAELTRRMLAECFTKEVA